MSRRNKLLKFAELTELENVLEYSAQGPDSGLLFNGQEDIKLKGKWGSGFFKNTNPIILELACGRGEYTCALAEMMSEKNFLGVDVKGARIWKGAKYAQDFLHNAGFLRIRIEHIEHYFEKNEVNEIWITFPDPFLKEKKANRRLTSPAFLSRYQNFLKSDGIIHLKTDDDQLYEYTLDIIARYPGARLIKNTHDVYAEDLIPDELQIKTYYEKRHLASGKTIKYIQFMLANEV